eukprot:6209595-Pleurochrysis_carterae.AAC.4
MLRARVRRGAGRGGGGVGAFLIDELRAAERLGVAELVGRLVAKLRLGQLGAGALGVGDMLRDPLSSVGLGRVGVRRVRLQLAQHLAQDRRLVRVALDV